MTPVNIICIMNESFSDLRVAGEFETNEEFMPYFDSLRETAITGNLYMPVFGAGTSNSEFEFLSGDAMAMMAPGTTAYQFNVTEGEGTLVSALKEQGYETIALHPYPGENWNRDTCYRNMGFDQFLEWEYFQDCPLTRCYVGDLENYRKMVQVLEDKDDPSEKVFLFNVTMQNHGGYDVVYDNYDQEIYLTGDLEGKYPMADQYLSLIKTSDEALQWLLSYLEELDQPTMVVMFGDHQPSVEDEFYYEISGLSEDTVTSEESLIWYETPYLIWTNYGLEKQDLAAFQHIGDVFVGDDLIVLFPCVFCGGIGIQKKGFTICFADDRIIIIKCGKVFLRKGFCCQFPDGFCLKFIGGSVVKFFFIAV